MKAKENMNAEERALEAYPIVMSQHSDNCKEYDSNESERLTFIEGYHQAEKDLAYKARLSSGWDGFYYGQGYEQAEKDLELTWQDLMLIDQIADDFVRQNSKAMTNEEFYKEILKQFKERRSKQ